MVEEWSNGVVEYWGIGVGSADVRLGEGYSSYRWHSITSVDLYVAAAGLLRILQLHYPNPPVLQYSTTPLLQDLFHTKV